MSTPNEPSGLDSDQPTQVPPVPPMSEPVPAPPEQAAPSGPYVPEAASAPAPYGQAPAPAPYGQAPAPAPYGQASYGQQPQPQAPYGPPPYGPPAPAATDPRPKVLAIIGLILAVVGLLAAFVGFVPFVGIVFVVLGGILLAGGLVLSIMTLASKKQGGKGMGIAGLIVSVVGIIVLVFALIVSLVFLGLATSVSNTLSDAAKGTEVTQPSVSPSDGLTGEAATGSEADYVADLRPKVRALMHDVQPDVTDEQIDAIYSDELLVMMGQAMLAEYNSMGDDAIAQEATSMAENSGGVIDETQAEQFMRDVLASAQKYLKP